MNSFFISITQDLELKEDNEGNANTSEDVLDAFNSYPSIEKLGEPLKLMKNFHFNQYRNI